MTWTGPDRRDYQCTILDEKSDEDLTIADIAKILRVISLRLIDLKDETEEHAREGIAFKESIYAAFPERDFQEHYAYHKEKNEAKKHAKEILLEGKKKLFSGVVWGGLTLLGYGALEWIKQHLNS